MNILNVQNLDKKIGKKEILRDVSFAVNEGDILAFIGANGAGKTTTIKCILGLQRINKGIITINGFDIKKNFVKAIEKVGCIVESPDVYMYLTGYENLKMQASFYKCVNDDDIWEVIKLVGLDKRINDKVSKYSLGMRQRLGIAISLINKPKLLILDEPTNGLDPKGIKELRELLLTLAKKGMGILISSHNLSELESFCNKVCIIAKGEIIENASIDKIKETPDSKYLIKVDNTKKARKILKDKDEILDDNYLEVIKTEAEVALLIRDLVNNGILIYEVSKAKISLEEAFVKRCGGAKID